MKREDEEGGPAEGPPKEAGEGTATLAEMFALADSRDYTMLAFGTLFGLLNGCGDPLMIIFLGESMSALAAGAGSTVDEMGKVAIYLVVLGAALHVCATVQYGCFSALAKSLGTKLRNKWFRSLMRQDTGWFDSNDPGGLTGRISSSILSFEDGIGPKLGLGVQFLSTFLTAIVVSFVYNVYVSLLTIAAIPLVAASGALLVKVNTDAAEFSENAYARANSVAHETFQNLKTVLSLNAGSKMLRKYESAAVDARNAGIRRALKVGVANGCMLTSFDIMYLAVTLFGGWALSTQIRDNGCDPSGVMEPRFSCEKFKIGREMDGIGIFIGLMGVAIGGQALGQVSTAADAFSVARKAIKPGVDVIARRPAIDVDSAAGERPDAGTLRGRVSMEKVRFAYPTRPGTVVCDDMSLEVEPGTTLALVGESGCGKSTVVQLLQRFYDPLEGSVCVDGHDVRDLNVQYLRQHIALVAQEPKLFSGSIAENIAHGLVSAGGQATHEDIVRVAKMANAHKFIKSFPGGYDTAVGHGGSQLSGGQKQRIAIARALLKQPKVLLLDEATSALDNKSERVVQKALDKILQETKGGMTTIIIAHRLSTIRNADQIAYVKDGRVAEKGTHAELMRISGGNYRALVKAQELSASDIAKVGAGGQEDGEDTDDEGIVIDEVGVSENGRDALSSSAEKSEDGKEKDSKEKKGAESKPEKVQWGKIWKINLPDMNILVVGMLGATVAGASYPIWGLLFAKMITAFFVPVLGCSEEEGAVVTPQSLGFATCADYFSQQADKVWDDAVELAYLWAAVAIVTLLSNTVMFYGFGAASERLSHRVRNLMFSSYVRQEPGYYDMPENSVGALTARLAKDATMLRMKTGQPLQNVFMLVFGVCGGVAVALVYAWPIALMAIGIIPILGAALGFQTAIVMGEGMKPDQGKFKDIDALAGESLTSMRTVASFGLEGDIAGKFSERESGCQKGRTLEIVKKSNVFGFSFAAIHWCWALLLWFGAWVIDNMDGISMEDFNIAVFGFFFGLFGLAMASQGAADSKEAAVGLTNIFNLLDRVTKIDPKSEGGEKPADVSGGVEMQGVDFRYPSRLELQVCDSFSMRVEAGMKIGLVGPSGSGKSTCVQLIERFYDPDDGDVLFDGKPLPAFNYSWLHYHIGMVGQEPALFNGTVADNIGLGYSSTNSADSVLPEAPLEAIEEAAKLANVDKFVASLPEGYQTNIGPGGTLLSGGQKQRIAIARALLSKPKVLLLDEATSALDAENEAEVQGTLDRLIRESQLTTIAIAHRLSTIRHMDCIGVVSDGRLLEWGTHDALLAQGGIYASLVSASV